MFENVRRAFHDSLHDPKARLSPKEIAARMGKGVSLSILYSWGEVGEYGHDIPIDRLRQYTLITGDPRPLIALCTDLGYTIMPVPNMERDLVAGPIAMRALHEFSEFLKSFTETTLDNKTDHAELNAFLKEANDAKLSIASAEAYVRSLLKEKPKP